VNILGTLGPRPATARQLVSLEQRFPPLPGARIEEVNPRTTARPAPTLVLSLAALRLDKNALVRGLLVNWVV